MSQFFKTIGISREKFYQMLLTALLSALIAFLQNIFANVIKQDDLQNTPAIAGAVGGTLSYFIKNKA